MKAGKLLIATAIQCAPSLHMPNPCGPAYDVDPDLRATAWLTVMA
jgi:hypothetical protein